MKLKYYRWTNDWDRGTIITPIGYDWDDSNYDFCLPEGVTEKELHKLERKGTGFKGWFYINFLLYKYR